ncbi:thioredoxin family protein [bacterium]|nr:thioredoxin family protein [bacterium]
MVMTPSQMAPLGSPAPDFALPDVVSGELCSREDLTGSPLLVLFICNHCPFVHHVQEELLRIGREYGERGVQIVAISSNDAVAYPDDSPEKMKELAESQQFPFPYLYDESQEVARSYQATCTPDFFLFDEQHTLVYRGQLDESRPGNDIPVTGRDLRAALENLLAGAPVSPDQKPSIGCNIKWKG